MLLKLPWTALAIVVNTVSQYFHVNQNTIFQFCSINERQSTCVVSVAVSPSILKERISRHQTERCLVIKAQNEAHLFPSEVLALGCHAAVEGGERCEGGPGFLGPARLTVLCAPLQETTTVSLLQSTKRRDKKGLQRLERQQNVLKVLKRWKDRGRQRRGRVQRQSVALIYFEYPAAGYSKWLSKQSFLPQIM